jgi:branched-subunit amino acid transport protein
MDLVDHLGDYIKSLPPNVQTFIGFTFIAVMSAIFVYALITPDPICVGCP